MGEQKYGSHRVGDRDPMEQLIVKHRGTSICFFQNLFSLCGGLEGIGKQLPWDHFLDQNEDTKLVLLLIQGRQTLQGSGSASDQVGTREFMSTEDPWLPLGLGAQKKSSFLYGNTHLSIL